MQTENYPVWITPACDLPPVLTSIGMRFSSIVQRIWLQRQSTFTAEIPHSENLFNLGIPYPNTVLEEDTSLLPIKEQQEQEKSQVLYHSLKWKWTNWSSMNTKDVEMRRSSILAQRVFYFVNWMICIILYEIGTYMIKERC